MNCIWSSIHSLRLLALFAVLNWCWSFPSNGQENLLSLEQESIGASPVVVSLDEVQPPDCISSVPANRWWFTAGDIGGYQAAPHLFNYADSELRLWGVGRGLFYTDGRYEFTGQETSLAAEGQLLADWTRRSGDWWTGLTGECYLTQPFDRNILVDDPLRASYAHNFEIETLQLSQLFVSLGNERWTIDFGKFITPFGRYYGPIYTNLLTDLPFIRGEAIRLRETGAQLRYHSGIWRHSAAITNGSSDRDTNSSKALVARAGWDTGDWAGGLSVKTQDGIGSEGQKSFNNHTGIDLSWTHGRLRLAGEVIFDEYGTRRPGLDLNDITWGRSLYNRQLNEGLYDPITGTGWYLNATWTRDRGTSVVGFGQYFPEFIGDPINDQDNWRILLKNSWQLGARTELFASGFIEPSLENFAIAHTRYGYLWLAGLQFHF
jgi:hypothetical protein